MQETTQLLEHWGTDIQISNEVPNNPEAYFVQASIDADLKIKDNLTKEISTNDVRDNENEMDAEMFFQVPKYKQNLSILSRRFTLKTKKWFGYVIEVKEDSFVAKLYDQSEPDTGTFEIIEFDYLDITDDDDRSLLKVGATFYWSVGYSIRNSQRIKQATLKFKRTGNYSPEEFDEICDKADELYDTINWEE